jgi:hypothetical protein
VRRRVASLLLLAGGVLLARTGRGEDVAVTVRERNVYEVAGSFEAPVPRAVAWVVLADYVRIGDFVPTVKKSRVVEQGETGPVVEQVLTGGWGVFSRRVSLRLRIRETSPGSIAFEDIEKKDFDAYAGEWRLEERPGGTAVLYRLRAEPKFHVPAFILRGFFKKGARELLQGVREEMTHRAGAPAPGPAS